MTRKEWLSVALTVMDARPKFYPVSLAARTKIARRISKVVFLLAGSDKDKIEMMKLLLAYEEKKHFKAA